MNTEYLYYSVFHMSEFQYMPSVRMGITLVLDQQFMVIVLSQLHHPSPTPFSTRDVSRISASSSAGSFTLETLIHPWLSRAGVDVVMHTHAHTQELPSLCFKKRKYLCSFVPGWQEEGIAFPQELCSSPKPCPKSSPLLPPGPSGQEWGQTCWLFWQALSASNCRQPSYRKVLD